MRSTLIASIVAIVLTMVAPAFAGEVNWSAGVSLSEKEPGTQIGSRIEASRDGRLVGAWFASSGQLPVIVVGMEYSAYGDFPGVERITEVMISPDKGITRWKAEKIEGRGYTVALPTLPAGSYGLEWGVVSRDKRNRITLVIIPINWSSKRTTGMVNQIMVQNPPLEAEGYSDQMWFSLLRGFVPAWATPDPAFVALQNMQNQPQPPIPVVQPDPPKVAPQPPDPTQPVVEIDEEPYRAELTAPSEVTMVLQGNSIQEFPVSIKAKLAKGDRLVFKRAGRFVAEAMVTRVIGHSVEAKITKGGGVRSGDQIFRGGK